ncbi:MAG TPA: DUF1080 domain-containing protein [Tepidisphaeraceae bacterium]|jgi:hypothetical protein|nr:DUF1080 domain-containing protein [Tepidisphaeraceae bacterium]
MQARLLIASMAAIVLTGTMAFCEDKPAKAPAVAPYEGTGDLKIDKPEDKEDVKPVTAPEGAIVLFNGKDVSNWVSNKDKSPAKWEVVDGVLQGKPGSGDILSQHQFEGAYHLHVEFRVPYEPNNHDQGRGNSGVYLNSHWEVQVLDSYHNKTYADGACGAIYSIEPPKENAAKAPTVWQSYDIEFHPAKCEDGKVVERPTATVVWNGVKVHDNTKLTKDNTPAGNGGDICKPGPLKLQDHGHPVQFRNIWAEPLK